MKQLLRAIADVEAKSDIDEIAKRLCELAEKLEAKGDLSSACECEILATRCSIASAVLSEG